MSILERILREVRRAAEEAWEAVAAAVAAWINKPDDPEAARKIAAQRGRRINPNPKRRHRRSA